MKGDAASNLLGRARDEKKKAHNEAIDEAIEHFSKNLAIDSVLWEHIGKITSELSKLCK